MGHASKSSSLLRLAFILAVTFIVFSEAAKKKRLRQSKADPAPVTIPGFVKFAHKVSSGTVTIKDSRTIHIKNFTYDGAGPDAYFWVGKGSEPNGQGRKIANENGSFDVLEGYEGNDITLTLPDDLTWKDVTYLSVYCVSFKHNFGHVAIPSNLNVPEYQDSKKV